MALSLPKATERGGGIALFPLDCKLHGTGGAWGTDLGGAWGTDPVERGTLDRQHFLTLRTCPVERGFSAAGSGKMRLRVWLKMGSGGRDFAEKRHLPRKRGKRGADWEKADWQTGQGLLHPLGEVEEAGRRGVAHHWDHNAYASSQLQDPMKKTVLGLQNQKPVNKVPNPLKKLVDGVPNLAFAMVHVLNPKALVMNENEYL
jgi:hypothetical protein